MSSEEFRHGMRVIHVTTRRQGTVTSDMYSVCGSHEIAVRFDGEEGYHGIDASELILMPSGGGWLDPSIMVAVH